MSEVEHEVDGQGSDATAAGLLPREEIEALIASGAIASTVAIEAGQLQPASLDLRLGDIAFRVRASFLTGRARSVASRLRARSITRCIASVLISGSSSRSMLMRRRHAPSTSENDVAR